MASDFAIPTFPERFNMADYYLDARVREGRGGHIAVRVGDARFTYSQVQRRANRARHALSERGIDIEDRVLLLLPDGIAFVDAWFGALKAGAVFCMGNPLATAEDFDYLLGYTRARAVVAHASTMDRLTEVIDRHPRCRTRFVVEGEHPGFESFEEALAGASDATDNADTSRDDVAGWLFTSGTTGKPKGAIHFHHDFPYNTELYAKRVLGLCESDVFVSVSRLFFGYATGTNLMFPFAVGGTAVLFPDKPTPARLFEHIEQARVTVLTNVPAMIRQMVDAVDGESAKAPPDLRSLRMCLSAGEALPPELYERWIHRWPGVEILDGIGSAELFHIYITNRPGDVRLGSLGRVVEGYEARIVGPDGDEVEGEGTGRLWVKGDSAALCYFGDQEKSKEVFKGDDWVCTADLFHRDSDGYFYYEGRADDMLKVRGMFVSPLEIEDCLATHPAVRECAVVGADDGSGLVVPKAFVAVRDGIEAGDSLAAELQEHVRSRLAKYKYPRVVAFVESLPRNDRGKIVRRELR
jgi:benzoate-CoA ligase family protein